MTLLSGQAAAWRDGEGSVRAELPRTGQTLGRTMQESALSYLRIANTHGWAGLATDEPCLEFHH